jgi:hypothetical protein
MPLPVKFTLTFILLMVVHGQLLSQTPVRRDTTIDKVDTNQLKEVVVNGAKAPFQRLSDRLVVNIAGNRFFRTATNALELFRKIPGLEVSGEGAILLSGRITPAVFIDGKPVPMSPEELQNYLTSLTPDMITSIEVINNPSGQYDAEYKGIINIKLKSDTTLGWKGTVSTNVQQNAYTYAENNLLLTYKTRKLLYTARLGYATGDKIYRYNAYQHLANSNTMTTNTGVLTKYDNINYQLGVDYTIKKGQRIEALLRAYEQNRDAGSRNTLYTTNAAADKVVSSTYTNNDYDPTQKNYAANLNYTAQWGKTQLQVINSLVGIRNRQNEDIQNKNTLTDSSLFYWKTAMKNDILIRATQADLSGNAGNGKWGAGAKFVFTTTRNDLRYDTMNIEHAFVPDSGRTNSFRYDEYITAGYLSYERKWKRLNLAASLRLEHTHSIGNAVTIKQVTDRNYLSWLPAFTLTYDIGENKQVNLSYSRRITRPNFAQLNPFRFYFSPLNYWIGNPNLQPSTTNTVVISYSQKEFTVSGQIGKELDPMTRYPEYDSATNTLEYLGRNLPYNNFAVVEASFPLTITPWWRMSHTVGVYYKKEQTPYHNVTYTIPITHYTISGSQVFTLPKGFTADLSYYYRSRSGTGLYIGMPQYNVDMGLQKTWLKGKINSKLNYYDMLNTNKVYWIFREKSIINNELRHWFGTRRVALTLSYSFGKSSQKARQDNKSDEENRAGL